jgi:two-component system, OmpR family, sensor kinase
VDMLTLAADAVHDARLVAPDRSINLTVGAGAALLVIGDEVRLRQVIGNLMSNALNHTPEGTPIEVRVRLGSLDEWRTAAVGTHRAAVQGSRRGAAPDAGRAAVGVAGARRNAQPFPAVVFEIADQGPGLTPAQAEHVFERFYRVDQARTRHSGGAGLGLAIVAALVPAHGGTVWVESPPGGGAIFRIAIPLAPEARNSAADFDDSTDPGIPGVVDPYRPLGPAFTSEESPAARPDPPPLPKRHPGLSGHART